MGTADSDNSDCVVHELVIGCCFDGCASARLEVAPAMFCCSRLYMFKTELQVVNAGGDLSMAALEQTEQIVASQKWDYRAC